MAELWRVPIRGGNWSNGANAGLAYLNLNNVRSNVNNNIGLRPALPLKPEAVSQGKLSVLRGKGAIILLYLA
jgi:hypothetical protein